LQLAPAPTPPSDNAALANKSAFRTAPEEVATSSKVAEMPDELWAALKFFLAETELTPREAAAIEASFKEVILNACTNLEFALV